MSEMEPSADQEDWDAYARVTDEHAAPGERTYRYVNGQRHDLGHLPPGTTIEKRQTLLRVLWKTYRGWRKSRRRTLDLGE